MTESARPARALAAMLTASGIAHVAVPKLYDRMIPGSLPGTSRQWVLGSGVAEFALAAAVAIPRSRRLGGLASAGFFVAIMPAHIKMAADARGGPTPVYAAMLVRMPLQIPLVAWALRASRS